MLSIFCPKSETRKRTRRVGFENARRTKRLASSRLKTDEEKAHTHTHRHKCPQRKNFRFLPVVAGGCPLSIELLSSEDDDCHSCTCSLFLFFPFSVALLSLFFFACLRCVQMLGSMCMYVCVALAQVCVHMRLGVLCPFAYSQWFKVSVLVAFIFSDFVFRISCIFSAADYLTLLSLEKSFFLSTSSSFSLLPVF